MKNEADRFAPLAREEGLVIQELPGELLVYDLERHKAHCLNETAAIVWRHCDGQTSVKEMTSILETKQEGPVDEEVVWLALDQLGKSRLLQQKVARPAQAKGMSRRELVQKLGLAAALSLPVVTSLVAPTAVQAVTCNTPCPGGPSNCISVPGCPNCVSGNCSP